MNPPTPMARVATDDDLPAIISLYEQLADGRSNAAPASSSIGAQVFAEIDRQPGRTLVVAEIGGVVRGTLDVLVVPNLTHGGGPWMVVDHDTVDVRIGGRTDTVRLLGIDTPDRSETYLLSLDAFTRARRSPEPYAGGCACPSCTSIEYMSK